MFVIGIDGGGTKTAGIVADENGTVYMKAETGRSNPNTLSKKDFEMVLIGLLEQLRIQNEEIYRNISTCFAGMAGVGESNRHLEVEQLLAGHLPKDTKIFIDNDAVNALYSGTLGKPGIVQISGTGAITVGMNGTGKTERVGGWGYLFDDLGSGYDLGNKALQAVFKAYDGRGQETIMAGKIKNYFQVERVPDLIEKIYGQEHPRTVIAPLSKIVIESALENDVAALTILEVACREMAQSIVTCCNKLFTKEDAVMVVLSGGVFHHFDLLSDMIKDFTETSLPNLIFMPTVVEPVGGAVAAGLAKMGVELNPEFVIRLNEGVSR